jgi:molecular chaperone GrpE
MNDSKLHTQSQEMNNATQDVQKTAKMLSECQEQLEHAKRNYALLNADFDNFKKRLEKEQSAVILNKQKSLILPLLDIVDNFDRALSESSISDKAMAAHLEGFSLIRKNLQKLLEKFGVHEIKQVQKFDPHLHEAVMSEPASDDKESGSITAVLQKGYMLNDNVLRPAKVKIVS